jgi:hypothetical protein
VRVTDDTEPDLVSVEQAQAVRVTLIRRHWTDTIQHHAILTNVRHPVPGSARQWEGFADTTRRTVSHVSDLLNCRIIPALAERVDQPAELTTSIGLLGLVTHLLRDTLPRLCRKVNAEA